MNRFREIGFCCLFIVSFFIGFSQKKAKHKHVDRSETELSDTSSNAAGKVKVAANPEYKAGGIKKFLMGENYRKEWTTPVSAPALDWKTRLGGLKPTKEGGGKETKSLRVEDASGREWALRS
ncbi:MAG TPA: hypothetical protein VGO09_09295, partial [Flavisolibacter sp.]|nr:hypothetical protein [Flavisolibacter sp.]